MLHLQFLIYRPSKPWCVQCETSTEVTEWPNECGANMECVCTQKYTGECVVCVSAGKQIKWELCVYIQVSPFLVGTLQPVIIIATQNMCTVYYEY